MNKLVSLWVLASSVAGLAACGGEVLVSGTTIIDDPRKTGQLNVTVSRDDAAADVALQCVEISCGDRASIEVVQGSDGTFTGEGDVLVGKRECVAKGYATACGAEDKTGVAVGQFLATVSDQEIAQVSVTLTVQRPNPVAAMTAYAGNFWCVKNAQSIVDSCNTAVPGSTIFIGGQLFDIDAYDGYDTGFRVDCGLGFATVKNVATSFGRFTASLTLPTDPATCVVQAYSAPHGTQIESTRNLHFTVK